MNCDDCIWREVFVLVPIRLPIWLMELTLIGIYQRVTDVDFQSCIFGISYLRRPDHWKRLSRGKTGRRARNGYLEIFSNGYR